MPIETAIWLVNEQPKKLEASSLLSERELEDMIVCSPKILSDEWMLIGRQERTTSGGIVDLLAIAPDGGLILIELKRHRTPREVVAQALDYACWVEGLEADDIAAIYSRFAPNADLAEDFATYFGAELDEDSLNENHQIVIVAAQLDESSERIVAYLNERSIAINVLFFQVFELEQKKLLSRAWLLDPDETQVAFASASRGTREREREPWNGEFYANFGHGDTRDWSEGRRFGFISAGGGSWYSTPLKMLKQGDRVWVKAPKFGFVGVGEVIGPRQSISEFEIETENESGAAQDLLSGGTYHREHIGDPDKMEYFVPVRWVHTVPLDQAVNEIGLFGNQGTVCRPTTPSWRTTVERLKQRWNLD